jgi:DNA-binding CsgD family transcriptional regulator/DNA polymerase III delta prime subunit
MLSEQMSRRVIGREGEFAAIAAFLGRVVGGPAALLFAGEPGIGKTALWSAAIDQARSGDAVVLSFRAVEAEASVSFACLSDLLGDALEGALESLSAPRRHALEVALLLVEPGGAPPDPRAVGLALRDVLGGLAASAPVLVAVDDLQWVDSASAAVLQFALRRLRTEPVGLLATVRGDAPTRVAVGFDKSFDEGRVERVTLGPLSRGASFQLLGERVEIGLSAPQLARLHELTAGNPFYLLELGSELARTGVHADAGQSFPVPRDLAELLAGRLGRVAGWTRELLLAVAASPRSTVGVLEAGFGDRRRVREGLERATRAGVLELEGSRVRFVHPLLASVCYQAAPLWRRRAVHRMIANAVAEPEERARHLALAAEGPDAEVAAALDAAAERAAARGAPVAAGELCELAADATPSGSETQGRARRLRAATFHRLSGDGDRAAAILERLLAEAAPGSERADVLFAMAQGRRGDLGSIIGRCEEALADAGRDDRRRARILAFSSWMRLIAGDVAGALGEAREGLRSAERVGDPVLLAPAIARVAMAELWALDITPGLLERGTELERELDEPLEFHESPAIALARRLICESDLDRARPLLQTAAARAADRGDERTRGHVLFHLVMLEWFAGRWDDALVHARTVLVLAEQLADDQFRGMVLHGRALVDAHRGDVEAARSAAAGAAALADAVADAIFPVWNEAVLGHLELSLGNPEAAAAHLGALPERLTAMGWNDPASSVWPDAVEALVQVGEHNRAATYLARYEALAQRSGSVWALATSARCRGLLSAAQGGFDAAYAAFERALAEHDRMPGSFERGRTLLAYGAVRRRARQRGAAREALQAALEIFEQQGAQQWARRAGEELGRISGRRPGGAELTETELRVARLAVAGRANKEIATALFMSVHTVEAHLSRVYRKLGVRYRTQLSQHPAVVAEAEVKP